MNELPFHKAANGTKLFHVEYCDRTGRRGHRVGARQLFLLLLTLLTSVPCQAQMPRITTLFPIGGRAGSTVEVELRGSNLGGANAFLVNSQGITGTVQPGDAKVDETNRPLWQSKCASCHELRSPSNRSMTPAQWAATVERMVRVRQAPLSEDEMEKVTQFLVSAARAGRVTAQIKIAPDTLPGMYEVRIATKRGLSTAAWFEVGSLTEVVGASGKREEAQPIKLPCVANGSFMESGERHFFKFTAKKGERLVFNLKAFRYHEATQLFFNPNLRLYDSSGKEIAENHGYYALDPLLDWQCPADGDYTLEARDLLGRGNPGSVYRLTMGALPYDTVLYPPGGKTGSQASFQVIGARGEGVSTSYALTVPSRTGVQRVGSPFGSQTCIVTPYPVMREEEKGETPLTFPCSIAGRISGSGETDNFTVQGEGSFEIEVYAAQVGSPLATRVQLLKPDGNALLDMNSDGKGGVKLEAGQKYTLRVRARNNRGGLEYVYFIEARPARPTLSLAVRPDNITLRAGQSTAVEIAVMRRDGIEGNIEVNAEALPAGITATKAIIPSDRNQGWLILTAAPNASETTLPFTITAKARGPLGEAEASVTPQEFYRLNNNPRYLDRLESVLTVRGQRDFTASHDSEKPILVHPRDAVDFKVKIKRREGYRGSIVLRMSGLPSGWTANPVTLPGDREEATLKIRPDGNNTQPFLNRDKKLPLLRAIIEATVDDFEFVVGTVEVQPAPINKNDLDD